MQFSANANVSVYANVISCSSIAEFILIY